MGKVYVSHERSKHHDHDIFDAIETDIFNLQNECDLPIVMVGDYNVRTGMLDDVVTCDDNVAEVCGLDSIYVV